MPTNFHLAPPSKLVDGLIAVPIDIQTITASLTFDGASQSGSGDATLTFIIGPQAGSAIFDLRQTITAAWLDGTPIALTKSLHDFGGGAGAALRVLASMLAAGSMHTLRIPYSLGIPQAPAPAPISRICNGTPAPASSSTSVSPISGPAATSSPGSRRTSSSISSN